MRGGLISGSEVQKLLFGMYPSVRGAPISGGWNRLEGFHCSQEFIESVFNRKSEAFEAFAIVRVEALLKDACALKERLQHQKQALIARLKAVTGILEESGEQDYVANTCT